MKYLIPVILLVSLSFISCNKENCRECFVEEIINNGKDTLLPQQTKHTSLAALRLVRAWMGKSETIKPK